RLNTMRLLGARALHGRGVPQQELEYARVGMATHLFARAGRARVSRSTEERDAPKHARTINDDLPVNAIVAHGCPIAPLTAKTRIRDGL
ncbi:MAG TPA: hypothetical protein VMS31_11035, partial [Pyrinomonadaceae bacterium]|nr:hypothetical protein [Pyrinomonadaceae bacterium]